MSAPQKFPLQQQEALRLAGAGVPIAMISRSLDVPYGTVRRWLRKSSGSSSRVVRPGEKNSLRLDLDQRGAA